MPRIRCASATFNLLFVYCVCCLGNALFGVGSTVVWCGMSLKNMHWADKVAGDPHLAGMLVRVETLMKFVRMQKLKI